MIYDILWAYAYTKSLEWCIREPLFPYFLLETTSPVSVQRFWPKAYSERGDVGGDKWLLQ